MSENFYNPFTDELNRICYTL